MTILIIMMVINRLLYGIIKDNNRTNRGIKHYYNDSNNVDTDEVESEKISIVIIMCIELYRNGKTDDSFK